MIRNYSHTSRPGRPMLAVLSALLLAHASHAQDGPVPAEQPGPTGYRSAVRVDVGGILASNFANTALGNGGALLPLLASYERQLSTRFSVVGEGLLNGGSASERKAGLSVQGRYYFRPYRGSQGLAGFYVAPVAAFRTVKLSSRYEPTQQRRFVGGGALLGWQGALRPGSRFFLDVAAGLMHWQHVG